MRRALDRGSGLETDIRDLESGVVISHDPPCLNGNNLTLDWLFKYISLNNKPSRLALNIKADGLAEKVSTLMKSYNVARECLFAFDMSIPDGLGYVKQNIPIYSRVSEYEDTPSYSGAVNGIWVDNFTGEFPQVKSAKSFLALGIRAAVVSSELHGRDHNELWADIFKSEIYKHPLFELCTDFPNQAADLFSSSESHD